MKNNIIDKYGEPFTLEELGEKVVKQINSNIQKANEVVLFKWNIQHTEKVSNSHNCPIEGVKNFARSTPFPKSYPGWTGRVWLVLKKDTLSFGSDPLKNTHVHFGSGGYGYYDLTEKLNHGQSYEHYYPLSWDFRVFQDDWKCLVWSAFMTENKLPHHHVFCYNAEKTV